MKTRRRRPLAERLERSLTEAVSHAAGELTLRTVEVPESPPEIDGETIAAVRKRAAMSQAVFAGVCNVSVKTLQSWEQGARRPSDASRRLLQLFCTAPEVVCRSAGLPEIQLSGVVVTQAKRGHRRIVVQN